MYSGSNEGSTFHPKQQSRLGWQLGQGEVLGGATQGPWQGCLPRELGEHTLLTMGSPACEKLEVRGAEVTGHTAQLGYREGFCYV